MTQSERNNYLGDVVNEMREILTKKGEDYSANEDVNEIFKVVGAICNVSPEKVVQIMIAIKLYRISALTDKQPNYESVKDSSIDLNNYAFIHDSILKEKNAK